MMQRQISEGENRSADSKVRIYEIAKEVGLPNKDLVEKVRGLGIDVKNHMSSIDVEDVMRVKRVIEEERIASREEKRISRRVFRRRSKASDGEAPAPPVGEASASPPPAVQVPVSAAPSQRLEPEAPVARPPSPAQATGSAPAQTPTSGGSPSVESSGSRLSEDRPAGTATVAAGGSAQGDVAQPAEVRTQAASAAASSGSSSSAGSPAERSLTGTPADSSPTGSQEAPSPAAGAGQTGADSGGKTVVEPASDAQPQKQEGKEGAAAAPKPAPKREIRIAEGFQQWKEQQQRRQQKQAVSEAHPVSAAEAVKMMTTRRRPGAPAVIITTVDSNKGFDRGRFRPRPRSKKRSVKTKGKATQITTPAEHKRIIRLEASISVADLAHQMGVKSNAVLRKLWGMGLTNVMITHTIDSETASLLAGEFGYEVEDVGFKEEDVLKVQDDRPEDLSERAPVVTVMGHVDHGKTSLLDAIRGTDVVKGEAGGITQHMGAYRVRTGDRELVFLDTPGHEAFTAMRARGAQCTDIVVLVVAADDGVMPQTVEAIDHARDANVPIVVAVNKIDKPDANPNRVMTELASRNLVAEDLGGEVLFKPVSAITKEGIEGLLEAIGLQSELLELRANTDKSASGTVVEARMDRARGSMCTVLIQEGTLRVGDTVVVGEHLGKVRAMLDDRGNNVEVAGPSTPVELLGVSGVPQAGDTLNAVDDDKSARTLAEHRREAVRKREMGASAATTAKSILEKLQRGESQDLKLLVKADVHGSAEAVKESLVKLGTEKVSVNVISSGVGGITESDVNLASSAGAIIIGFSVRPAGKASQLAEREGVDIRQYDVIYELLDDTKDLMRGLLPKERKEKLTGRAEVRQTFTIPKIGTIGGCAVVDGKITRNSHLRLVRDSVKIYDGRISSLKRFKEDTREVVQGYECGIGIENYNDLKEGDIIEAYEIEEVTPDLE